MAHPAEIIGLLTSYDGTEHAYLGGYKVRVVAVPRSLSTDCCLGVRGPGPAMHPPVLGVSPSQPLAQSPLG